MSIVASRYLLIPIHGKLVFCLFFPLTFFAVLILCLDAHSKDETKRNQCLILCIFFLQAGQIKTVILVFLVPNFSFKYSFYKFLAIERAIFQFSQTLTRCLRTSLTGVMCWLNGKQSQPIHSLVCGLIG